MKMHKKLEARKEKEQLDGNEMGDMKNGCDDEEDDEQIEDDWDCSVGDEEEEEGGEDQDSNESSCDESSSKKSIKSEPNDCENDMNVLATISAVNMSTTKTPLPLPKGPKKVKLNFKQK